MAASAQIAFMTASDADRTPFVSAIALLDEAQVSWTYVDAVESIGDAAVVICLVRSGSDIAIQCARATGAPVLAVPWADELPTTNELLLRALDYSPELGIGVLAIGEAGMKNAALSAISILAMEDARIASWWSRFREEQTASVLADRELP